MRVLLFIRDAISAICEILNFSFILPDDSLISREIRVLLRNPEDRKKLSEAINELRSGKVQSKKVTFSDGSTQRFYL